MATILPESQAYQSALAALGIIVQQAYSAVSADMLLDIIGEDAGKYLFVNVSNKSPRYDGTSLYDFNIIGKTLAVDQTTYGSTPKTAVSYNNIKTQSDILTKNTPEATDDPVTVYSRSAQEFATRTAWRSNFYL